MDFGNISSSGNEDEDVLMDLYRYKYSSKIQLPSDIAGPDTSSNPENGNVFDTKELDLAVLYQAIYSERILKDKTNDTVWTFDSILNDLEDTMKSPHSTKKTKNTIATTDIAMKHKNSTNAATKKTT